MSNNVHLMKRRFILILILAMFVSTLVIPLVKIPNIPIVRATGFSDTFDTTINTALWDELIVNTGDVYIETGQLVANINTATDCAGLVTKEVYDLSNANISVFASINSANNVILAISPVKQTSADPWNNDDWYMIFLLNPGGLFYVMKKLDGAATITLYNGTFLANSEVFRMEISSGIITCYEATTQRAQEAFALPTTDCYITLYSLGNQVATLYGFFDNFVLEQGGAEAELPFYSGFEDGWDGWTNRTGSDNEIVSTGSIFNGTYVYAALKDSYIRTDAYSSALETEYLDLHVMFNGTFVSLNFDWFAQFGYNDENYINLGIYVYSPTELRWSIGRSNSSSVGVAGNYPASPLTWYNVTLGITKGNPANYTLWINSNATLQNTVSEDWSNSFDYAVIGIYDADDTDLNFRYDDILIASYNPHETIIPENIVYAESGYPDDIQAAVDEAQVIGVGTVIIPAGWWNWTDSYTGVVIGNIANITILGTGSAGCTSHPNWVENEASTILDMGLAPQDNMFLVDAEDYFVEIGSIKFRGDVVGDDDMVSGCAVNVYQALEFRIHHCTTENFPSMAIVVGNPYTEGVQPKGLVDHCLITNPYKLTEGGAWGYGVYTGGIAYDWDTDITHFLGLYEDISRDFAVAYIEDCVFRYCRHALASNQGGWYVTRFNKFYDEVPANFYMIDVHGGVDDEPLGGRGLEAYNNTLTGTLPDGGSVAFGIRGGGGVIFDNTIEDCSAVGIRLMQDNSLSPYWVKDLYVWNNILVDTEYLIDDYLDVYDLNVDYFLRAPSFALDGFTYTPYVYPHPLVGEISLQITSFPSGISFTLSGTGYETPVILELSGSYTAVFPESVTIGATNYTFIEWEDDSTNATRELTITESTSIIATYEVVLPEGFTPLIEDFNDELDAGIWQWLYPADISYKDNVNGYLNMTIVNPSGTSSPNVISTINVYPFEDLNIQVDKKIYTSLGNDYAYIGIGGQTSWSVGTLYLEFTTGYSNGLSLIAYNSSGRFFLYNTASHKRFSQVSLQFISENQSIALYEDGLQLTWYLNGEWLPTWSLDWFWDLYPSGNATISMGAADIGAINKTGVCFDNLFTYYGEYNPSLLESYQYTPALTNFAFYMPEPFISGTINRTFNYLPDMNISTSIIPSNGFRLDSVQINSTLIDAINTVYPYTFYVTANSSYGISTIVTLLTTHRLLTVLAHGYGIQTNLTYGVYAYPVDTEITVSRSYIPIVPPTTQAIFDSWHIKFPNMTYILTGQTVLVDLSDNVTLEVYCHTPNVAGTWFFRSATLMPYMPPCNPTGGYYWRQIIDELEELNSNVSTIAINYIDIRAEWYYNITTGKLTLTNNPMYYEDSSPDHVLANPNYEVGGDQGLTPTTNAQLQQAVAYAHAHGFKVYICLEQTLGGLGYPLASWYNTTSVRAMLINYRDNVVFPAADLFESWGVDDIGLSIEMQSGLNPSETNEPILIGCNDLWTETIIGVRDRFSGRITQQITGGYQGADMSTLMNASYISYLDYLILDQWMKIDVQGRDIFTSNEVSSGWFNSFGGTYIQMFSELSDFFGGKKIVLNMGYPNRYGMLGSPWDQYGVGVQFRHDQSQYSAWQGTLWAFEGQEWFGGIDMEGYNSIYNASITEDNYITGEYPIESYRMSWRAVPETREMIFEEIADMLLYEPPPPLGLAVYLTIVSSPYGSTNLGVGVHIYTRWDVVVLTATAANASYRWSYWLINGLKKNVYNPITVTMNKNYTYAPIFVSNAKSNVTASIMSYLPYFLFIAGVGIFIVLARGRRD